MGLTILLVDDDQILTEKTKNSFFSLYKMKKPLKLRIQRLYICFAKTRFGTD